MSGQDNTDAAAGPRPSPEPEVGAGKNGEQGGPRQYGAGLVMESRNWYKDKFRQTVILCMITAGLLAASLLVNLIQGFSKPSPTYFAVSDDLRLKQMQPLTEPSIDQSALFNWVTRTVTGTFSMDFVHWQEQLMEVRPEYSEESFAQLVTSLQSAGNLQMVRERRLVMSSVVKQAPVITAKGTAGGRMLWRLEFPITVTYESSERVVASQDLVCTVTVQRVSTLDHPRGVQIAQLVLR